MSLKVIVWWDEITKQFLENYTLWSSAVLVSAQGQNERMDKIDEFDKIDGIDNIYEIDEIDQIDQIYENRENNWNR